MGTSRNLNVHQTLFVYTSLPFLGTIKNPKPAYRRDVNDKELMFQNKFKFVGLVPSGPPFFISRSHLTRSSTESPKSNYQLSPYELGKLGNSHRQDSENE